MASFSTHISRGFGFKGAHRARLPTKTTAYSNTPHLRRLETAQQTFGPEILRRYDLAILRTTPALFGLFSLVTLFAHDLLHGEPLPVRQAAWYSKSTPTFAETLAFVRQHLWPATISSMSPANAEMVLIPRTFLQRLTDAVGFAA